MEFKEDYDNWSKEGLADMCRMLEEQVDQLKKDNWELQNKRKSIFKRLPIDTEGQYFIFVTTIIIFSVITIILSYIARQIGISYGIERFLGAIGYIIIMFSAYSSINEFSQFYYKESMEIKISSFIGFIVLMCFAVLCSVCAFGMFSSF